MVQTIQIYLWSYIFLHVRQSSILLGHNYLEIFQLLTQMHILEFDAVNSVFEYYTI